jgi:hypothetical protein
MSNAGRPLKFKSVEELQSKIAAYFAECDPRVIDITEWVEARDKSGKLLKDDAGLNYLVEVDHKVKTKQIDYTITGLAIALGTTRQTLLEYEGEVSGRDSKDPRYADTIKDAKTKIEAYWEQKLASPSPTGTIFNLKNNYGWKDKTEQDLTTGGDKIGPVLVKFVGDNDNRNTD